MKTRKLLKEIWKSGIIPLIFGYIIINRGKYLINYLVGGTALLYGLVLGYRYTGPKSTDTSETRSKEGDE